MRKALRIALRGLAVVVLALAVLGLWKREEIVRLMAVNTLFAEDRITRNFSHMDRLFLTRPLPRGEALVSTLPAAPGGALYGYQWWIPENAEGDFMARGIYGQYIYISPRHDTVIAVNAADRDFEAPGVDAANVAMLQAIAAAE